MAALVLCGTASAAPIVVGASTILVQPSVAVDGSGNAYVAFSDTAATNSTEVCEIPVGTTSCSHTQSFQDPLSQATGLRSYLFVSDDGVVHLLLVAGNGAAGAEDLYTSSNQGATWNVVGNPGCPQTDLSYPSCVGSLTVTSAAFDPTIGSPTSGAYFGASQNVHTEATVAAAGLAVNTATPGTTAADATLVAPWTDDSDAPDQTGTALSRTASGVALVNVWDSGTTPTSTGAQGVGYAYYSGTGSAALGSATITPQQVVTDTGTAGNWTLGALGDGGSDISLAGGPSGIVLNELSGSPSDFHVRAFTGTGFSAPVSADCGGAPNETGGPQNAALSEDPATGALQLAFVDTTSIGTGLYYTELAGGSQSPPDYSAPLYLSQNPIDNTTIASDGASHPGLAVYYDQGSGNVEAVWLPSVATTGCAKSIVPPPTSKTQSTSTKIGSQQITLTTPSLSTCTAASGKLSTSLAAAPIGSKSSPLKFSNAGFYLDKGIKHVTKHKIKTKHGHKTVTITTYLANATAGKLPATEQLSLTGLKSGTHTLTVKVTYKETKKVVVGHGKHKHKVKETIKVTHTLKAPFTVC